MTGTAAYHSYMAARHRCENPKNVNFRHYGGRGIKFLYSSFEQFFADLGEPPAGHWVERIDNHGHYEPGNCRWATPTQQNNNKRNNVMLSAFGRTRTRKLFAKEFKIHPATVATRIESGWSVEAALTTPLRRKRSRRRMSALDLIADGKQEKG